MNFSLMALAWRSLWRDLRAGELRLLVVAVTLAVAALTAVGFFSDRLRGGLVRDAGKLLGGDAVVASDQPTPQAFIDKARALGLQSVTTLTFPTMARATAAQGGGAKLAALKAVGPGYPLRGTLELQTPPGAAPRPQPVGIPAPGEVWADAALLQALEIAPGDTMLLGSAQLVVRAVIALEPDRGAGFMNFAPRVMIHQDDLAATELVQPASRLNYRMAVVGASSAQAQVFADWARQALDEDRRNAQPLWRGVRLESLDTGRPEMRQTLARAEKFLNLVALLCALLSAVAVALAARTFANRHLNDCAMLRVLGLGQRAIAGAYTLEFALVGLAASALGVALGFAVHHGFVWLMAGLVDAQLPAPSLWPVGVGLGMGLSLLLAFGLPPVLQLAQVPPLRVIRRDLGPVRRASLGVLALGLGSFAALLLAVGGDWVLGLITVGGFGLALLLFAGLGWVAIRLLRRSVNEATAPRWLVLATRQISARPVYAVVQVSALSVGLLALVLLVLLRTDLINSWRQASPPDAPNRFVINIMPEQGADFQRALAQAGVARWDWYPMVRARLVAVNGRNVSPEDYADERAQRLVDREFNVSYSAELPAHNTLVAGQWQAEEADGISIEEGLARTLNLQVGDRLRFDSGGTQTESRISSLRKVDWGSLRVNFFALYPVSHLDNVPTTFISAFRAPEATPFDNQLVRQFPNITYVDMSTTLRQVQQVLDQVIGAVQYLFGFTLVAGLVVLFAALTATREERTREFGILRALGAPNRLLRQVQRAELAGVGLLAGLLAAMVALLIGWALARYVFEFEAALSPWAVLWGSAAGAVLALLAGWWGLRDVLRQPVVQTLRQNAE